MTADQLRECREAFEKWADEYGLRYEPNYSAHTEADVFAAFQAAWNTRPAAVASHAEGEAVAWMVTRDRDPTFPRVYTEKGRAIACVDMVTLPPFAKIVDLYTNPPRSGDEATARYARLVEAVRAIYYAGVWTCDRPVNEAALWTALRDAAGFTPGQSPAYMVARGEK